MEGQAFTWLIITIVTIVLRVTAHIFHLASWVPFCPLHNFQIHLALLSSCYIWQPHCSCFRQHLIRTKVLSTSELSSLPILLPGVSFPFPFIWPDSTHPSVFTLNCCFSKDPFLSSKTGCLRFAMYSITPCAFFSSTYQQYNWLFLWLLLNFYFLF